MEVPKLDLSKFRGKDFPAPARSSVPIQHSRPPPVPVMHHAPRVSATPAASIALPQKSHQPVTVAAKQTSCRPQQAHRDTTTQKKASHRQPKASYRAAPSSGRALIGEKSRAVYQRLHFHQAKLPTSFFSSNSRIWSDPNGTPIRW